MSVLVEREVNLLNQLAECKQLMESRVMQSAGDREILTRLIRLIETLVNDRPTTEIQPRHHA